MHSILWHKMHEKMETIQFYKQNIKRSPLVLFVWAKQSGWATADSKPQVVMSLLLLKILHDTHKQTHACCAI